MLNGESDCKFTIWGGDKKDAYQFVIHFAK
jgi:hypothetical protein